MNYILRECVSAPAGTSAGTPAGENREAWIKEKKNWLKDNRRRLAGNRERRKNASPVRLQWRLGEILG